MMNGICGRRRTSTFALGGTLVVALSTPAALVQIPASPADTLDRSVLPIGPGAFTGVRHLGPSY
jgi:hypothetical protein